MFRVHKVWNFICVSVYKITEIVPCVHTQKIGFQLHSEKSFRNLIMSNRNQIIFTILPLIWNQTDSVCLVLLLSNSFSNLSCSIPSPLDTFLNQHSNTFLIISFFFQHIFHQHIFDVTMSTHWVHLFPVDSIPLTLT